MASQSVNIFVPQLWAQRAWHGCEMQYQSNTTSYSNLSAHHNLKEVHSILRCGCSDVWRTPVATCFMNYCKLQSCNLGFIIFLRLLFSRKCKRCIVQCSRVSRSTKRMRRASTRNEWRTYACRWFCSAGGKCRVYAPNQRYHVITAYLQYFIRRGWDDTEVAKQRVECFKRCTWKIETYAKNFFTA